VHEAQRRGMTVLPPHINESAVECRVERPGDPSACDVGEGLAVRVGLGYVLGVREEEVRRIVEERERGGPYVDGGDLASRSGASRDTLERLAWAGACEGIPRREALWQMGVVTPGQSVPGGVQLSLPLAAPEPPALRGLTPWERLVADYGSFRISIAEHPLALMRADLGEQVATSAALERLPHGREVAVAGLVVARQRPATANGVTFMLLEDELGTMNLIVAPPVFERHRLIVRTEPFVLARGRLERRTGTINVVVRTLRALERPDLPRAEVKQIEPPIGRETGRGEEELADLRAVAPVGHSFGRRGR
jgi:error-prone DNA polymerase